MVSIRRGCKPKRDGKPVPYGINENRIVGAGVPTALKGCANRDDVGIVPYNAYSNGAVGADAHIRPMNFAKTIDGTS